MSGGGRSQIRGRMGQRVATKTAGNTPKSNKELEHLQVFFVFFFRFFDFFFNISLFLNTNRFNPKNYNPVSIFYKNNKAV
jgi:hypothetical protein